DGIAEYIRINSNEHFVVGGTENDDVIVSGGGDDAIWGKGGNDRIEAGYGVDKVFGGEGDDIITNAGTDIGEADFLHGNEGNDVLNPGPGLDVMDGGEGADRYVFIPSGMSTTQIDRIYFSTPDGDVIDLSLIDAIAGGADNAFSFIGTNAFSGTAGELRYDYLGVWDEGPRAGTTYHVSGDVDGDGMADFIIEISQLGTTPPGLGDFIL
ncbi:MAG: calcium-binding protein, partial [Sphingopyxis sp.]